MVAGVSVVICCYNSATRILETLRHLSEQKTESRLSWEVILVDNASTDDTAQIARSYWKTLNVQDKLSIVNEPRPGLSYARATGINSSSYNVIIFCDDDNWLCSDYIENAFEIMESNPRIGLLGGEGIATSNDELPKWFDFYRTSFACYPQSDKDGELKGNDASLYGAGLVLRKESWTRLNDVGFKSILTDRKRELLSSGGDTEISYAIRMCGYSLWYSKQLRFKHFMTKERLTIDYLKRINKSLAYCSVKLQLYRYALNGTQVNLLTWFKDMAYKTFSLLKSISQFHHHGELNIPWYNFHFALFSWLGLVSMFYNYTFQSFFNPISGKRHVKAS
jgi:glycosyltransferase involved in cell wall biosynthesis